MWIDSRTHLFSLMAVFLALGLGILIGGVVLSDDGLIHQQRQLIARLENDFSQLRGERLKLQSELTRSQVEIAQLKEDQETILAGLLSQTLGGMDLGLIQWGRGENPLLAQVHRLAAWTGGEILWEVQVDPEQTEPGDLAQMAVELATGQDGEVLGELRLRGVIQTQIRSHRPIDTIILVGLADQSPMGLFEMVGQWQRLGVVVVAADGEKTSGLLNHLSGVVPTLDHLHTPMGLLALTSMLMGDGHSYGMQGQSLLPSLMNWGSAR